MYVSLIQFTDQGIRNIKDTVKRSEAAMAEAEKMGMKIIEPLWTMGAYDVVVLLEAPNDETMTAFALKVGSMGKRQDPHNARLPQGRDGRHSRENQITAEKASCPDCSQMEPASGGDASDMEGSEPDWH